MTKRQQELLSMRSAPFDVPRARNRRRIDEQHDRGPARSRSSACTRPPRSCGSARGGASPPRDTDRATRSHPLHVIRWQAPLGRGHRPDSQATTERGDVARPRSRGRLRRRVRPLVRSNFPLIEAGRRIRSVLDLPIALIVRWRGWSSAAPARRGMTSHLFTDQVVNVVALPRGKRTAKRLVPAGRPRESATLTRSQRARRCARFSSRSP